MMLNEQALTTFAIMSVVILIMTLIEQAKEIYPLLHIDESKIRIHNREGVEYTGAKKRELIDEYVSVKFKKIVLKNFSLALTGIVIIYFLLLIIQRFLN